MKKTFRLNSLSVGILSLSMAIASATNIYKADVTDTLNLGTSWTNGIAPGTSDIAIWDSNVVNNISSSPGAALNWQGIAILNPFGSITINNDANTLTLGASGIDMSLATTNFTVNSPIVLNGSQTWNVTNGLTMTAGGAVSGASLLTKTGNGTVILSVANSFTGGTSISNGTVQAGSGTAFGTGGVTNYTGSTLRIRTTTTIANNVTFNGNVTIDLGSTAGNAGLDGNWAGSGTVSFINQDATAQRTFTMGGVGSWANFTGTVLIGTNSGVFRFNDGGSSPNTGNANATLNLGNGGAVFLTRNRNAAVNLGALLGATGTRITNGTSSSGTSVYSIGNLNTPCQFDGLFSDASSTAAIAVTKVGSSTLTLTGPNTHRGGTTVSQGTLIVGTNGPSGTLGSGAIVNNAALVFNRSDDFTVANAISGSGTTIKSGPGQLTFSGANTSSGTLVVSNGTVIIGSAASISGPITILSGATLDVSQNPTFVLNQTLSGSGTVNGVLTAASGTLNPGGTGAAGTLTFANGLTESGNINHQFEFSTPSGSNDLIAVTGNLTLNGTNNIIANAFGGGTIPQGTYRLFTYTGNLNGTISNLAITIAGASGTFTNPAGEIDLIVGAAVRGNTNLTWVGDGVANAWDTTSTNWISGSTAFNFLTGDRVTFDDIGATNPTVTLASLGVQPSSVTVNSTSNYTFTGSGGILGTGGLTKTNTGTLTVLTTNSYTGPTVIGQGVLEVQYLANGNSSSAVGASSSDPTNLTFNGSTLRFSATSGSTDRNALLNAAGGNIDLPSGSSLALNGGLTGTGALTKSGVGTLTLNVASTYGGGTVISNGVLALGSNLANNNGLGATNGPVTFYGGTLQLFGYSGSTTPNYGTCYNPLVVPAGQIGTLRMFPRGPLSSGNGSGLASSLSGAGTLNLVVNYVRDNLDGNWSAFTGTINVTAKNGSGDEMRINNNFGYSNAAVILNDGVILDRVSSANSTVDLGDLSGTSAATVGPGNSSAQNPTWRVGWKNASSTFAGTIANDGTTSVTKVGTGTWTLTGQNTYSGPTTISNGVLALAFNANTSQNGSFDSSATIAITSAAVLDVSGRSDATLQLSAGQTLQGNGTVRGSANVSGVIAPGGVQGNIGTLTITNIVSLYNVAWMKLNRTNVQSSDRIVATNINIGGTIIVSNTGPALHVGDTFTLFSAPTIGGSASVVLPNYYTWDTSQLAVTGTISVTGVLPPPSISSVDIQNLLSGSITINATGGLASGYFDVLTSTNIALPVANWTSLGTYQFDGSGNFSGTITVDPTPAQQFYLLRAQ